MELLSSYLPPSLEAMQQLWRAELEDSARLRHCTSEPRASSSHIESALKHFTSSEIGAEDFVFVVTQEGRLERQVFNPQAESARQILEFNHGTRQVVLHKLFRLQQFLIDLPFEKDKDSEPAQHERTLFSNVLANLACGSIDFSALLRSILLMRARLLHRIDVPSSVRSMVLSDVRRTVDPSLIEQDMHQRSVTALCGSESSGRAPSLSRRYPFPVYSENALRLLVDLELFVLAWRDEVNPN